MAIIIKTNDPAGLQRLIYAAVDNGRLHTWSRRVAGSNELTHTEGGQWGNEAWLEPVAIVADSGELRFKIRFPANTDLTRIRAIYSVYHGRFISIITTHMYNNFVYGIGSAKPLGIDQMTEQQRTRLNT